MCALLIVSCACIQSHGGVGEENVMLDMATDLFVYPFINFPPEGHSFLGKESRCKTLFDRALHHFGVFYHLHTPEKHPVIFRNPQDYRMAMTIIATCAFDCPGIRIITFELMSNHVHFVVCGSEDEVMAFFELFKKRLKRYFGSLRKAVDLSGFIGKTVGIPTLEALRNQIGYTNRNNYVINPAYTPFSYPYGAGNCYFPAYQIRPDYYYKEMNPLRMSQELQSIKTINTRHSAENREVIRRSAMYGLEVEIKRLSDVVLSLCMLAVFSPLMLFISIVVKLQDGGPIIYKQRRVTKGGKLFWIYKFRSMIINSEEHGAMLSSEDDDRVTPFGRRLRDTHLDELPQLINVIKGDMSLVGPRPERPELIKEIKKELPGFDKRLQVKAGLTGFAQVYGDYEIETDKKLRYDMYYIKHFSLLLDMRLLYLTLGKILSEIFSR